MQGFTYRLYSTADTIPTKQLAHQFCSYIITQFQSSNDQQITTQSKQAIKDKNTQKQKQNLFDLIDQKNNSNIIFRIPVVSLLFIYWFEQTDLNSLPNKHQGKTQKPNNKPKYRNNNTQKQNIQLQLQFQDIGRIRKLRIKQQDEYSTKNSIQLHNNHNKQTGNTATTTTTTTNKYNYIYKVVEIQTSQSYNTNIRLSLNIKYGSNPKQYLQYNSLQQLTQVLSRREFGAFNDQVYRHIRIGVLFRQPLLVQYRYSPDKGYIWVKISYTKQAQQSPQNKEDSPVLEYKQHPQPILLHRMQLMNWLVPQHQKLRKYKSTTIHPFLTAGTSEVTTTGVNNDKKPVMIHSGEEISLMFTLPRLLGKVQIPYCLEYSVPWLGQDRYRIIKLMSIQ